MPARNRPVLSQVILEISRQHGTVLSKELQHRHVRHDYVSHSSERTSHLLCPVGGPLSHELMRPSRHEHNLYMFVENMFTENIYKQKHKSFSLGVFLLYNS
jgi:hypothetical protein